MRSVLPAIFLLIIFACSEKEDVDIETSSFSQQQVDLILEEAKENRHTSPELAARQAVEALGQAESFNYIRGKVQAHNLLASLYALKLNDHQKSQEHLNAYEMLISQMDDLSDHADFNYNKGLGHYKAGNYEMASSYLHKAMAYFEETGLDEKAAFCNYSLGLINRRLGLNDRAIEYYTKALDLLPQASPGSIRVDILNAIGLSRYDNHDYYGAGKVFDEALKQSRKINYAKGELVSANQLGLVKLSIDDFQAADFYLDQAMQLALKEGNSLYQGNAALNMGFLAEKQYQFELAEEQYQVAREIFFTAGRLDKVMSVYRNLSYLNLQQKNYSEALAYANEGLALEINNNEDRQALLSHAIDAYKAAGDYELVAGLQEKLYDLRIAVADDKRPVEIMRLQKQLETDLAEKRRREQMARMELAMMELKTRNTVYASLGLFLILVIGAAVFSYRFVKRTNDFMQWFRSRTESMLESSK
ncbi:tetratricopeptide repeat protein [Roseivirga sp. BDSF3-8]|uniref:tetratricopeptide repeat protein n=1 Tax=Roseivirga sp. BDSF3-8 TaxID=3241598 RepID=UPI003531E226